MKDLAILFRCAQLFAHNAHNLCARIVFFQDHEFLGDLYSKYESEYDSVIERIIGLQGSDQLDLVAIQIAAVDRLKSYPQKAPENAKYFEMILAMEKEICERVKMLIPTSTEGTKQLIGEMANQSEIRQYKIKQRISK